MKKIPSIDKINDAKSHIVKFSFKMSKVKRIAQMVLEPDLAATAASGKISEKALKRINYRGDHICLQHFLGLKALQSLFQTEPTGHIIAMGITDLTLNACNPEIRIASIAGSNRCFNNGPYLMAGTRTILSLLITSY